MRFLANFFGVIAQHLHAKLISPLMALLQRLHGRVSIREVAS
jgi:hypothetical protein